jgi:hypothetical protein
VFPLEPALGVEEDVVAGGCDGFAGLCLDWVEAEGEEGEEVGGGEEGFGDCRCSVAESITVEESFG